MSILCIECAMKAFVEGRPASEAVHAESPEQHMQRVHPDGGLQGERRKALEQQVLDKLHEQGMTREAGAESHEPGCDTYYGNPCSCSPYKNEP